MRRRRAAVLAAAVLGLAAIGAGVRQAATRSAAPGGGEWAEVRRADLVISVPVSGTLAAVDAESIGPPGSMDDLATMGGEFKITFMAPEGAEVRRGRPLLAFDTTAMEKILRDKEGERDSAQKKLEKRRAELESQRRDDELHLAQAMANQRKAGLKVDVPPELKSRVELDSAKQDLDLAVREIAYYKARLRLTAASGATELSALAEQRGRAAARVAEAQQAIGRLTIKAPRDGTVIYLQDHRGNKKKVGDSIWLNERVLQIPDLRRMRAEGEIDESDAGQVAPGQRVALHLDAHPEVTFAGRVHALRDAVQTRSSFSPVKVMKLNIDLDRTDPLRMRPGMRFAGTIEVDRAPAVVMAPLDAVIARSDGPLVYRRARFGVAAVHPRLGRRNDSWVEVLSGLEPGDLLRRAGDALPGGADGPPPAGTAAPGPLAAASRVPS
jgi:HlyD family secretion protein